MTPAERTRLLLLAASAGTEATLRRALFDWAMEGVEVDTPANPEKLVSTGRPGIDYPPDWYRPSGPLEPYNPWWPPNVPQDNAWQSKPDVPANPEKLAAGAGAGAGGLPDRKKWADRPVTSPQAPETACLGKMLDEIAAIRDLLFVLASQREAELRFDRDRSDNQISDLASAVDMLAAVPRPPPEEWR